MSVIKSKTTTYECSLKHIKELIAKDLNVALEAITVQYILVANSGEYDRCSSMMVSKLEITVDELKNTNRQEYLQYPPGVRGGNSSLGAQIASVESDKTNGGR